MLPATECRTKMMALTRAGCELINLWNQPEQNRCQFEWLCSCASLLFSLIVRDVRANTKAIKKKKTHSHIQHVRVCELHKEVFVLEHPCTGKHRVRGNDTICILAWCIEMAWQCLLKSAGLTEGNWVGPEPWCRHDDLIQRLFVCQHFIDLSVEGEDRKSRLLM